MAIHLQREIDKLKKDLLLICSIVEEQVEMAIRALLDRDGMLAKEVVGRDADVDRREIEVEEECLKTLALHQPVANDLRMLVAALKINNDLERIGDLAVNIARKALAFAAEPMIDPVHVARAVVYMAGLPLDANVLFMTVMATKMPFVGRG